VTLITCGGLFCVSLVSHYLNDIPCKNYNYVFVFVKIMPKILLVPFFSGHGVGVKLKVFDDDMKLYVKIMQIEDLTLMQSALDALTEWADNWQLSLAVYKCCVLNVSKVK